MLVSVGLSVSVSGGLRHRGHGPFDHCAQEHRGFGTRRGGQAAEAGPRHAPPAARLRVRPCKGYHDSGVTTIVSLANVMYTRIF